MSVNSMNQKKDCELLHQESAVGVPLRQGPGQGHPGQDASQAQKG